MPVPLTCTSVPLRRPRLPRAFCEVESRSFEIGVEARLGRDSRSSACCRPGRGVPHWQGQTQHRSLHAVSRAYSHLCENGRRVRDTKGLRVTGPRGAVRLRVPVAKVACSAVRTPSAGTSLGALMCVLRWESRPCSRPRRRYNQTIERRAVRKRVVLAGKPSRKLGLERVGKAEMSVWADRSRGGLPLSRAVCFRYQKTRYLSRLASEEHERDVT